MIMIGLFVVECTERKRFCGMGFTPNAILSLCAVIPHPCAQKPNRNWKGRKPLQQGYHYPSGLYGLRIKAAADNAFPPILPPFFCCSLPSRSGSCPPTAAWSSLRWTTTRPTTGRRGDTRRTSGTQLATCKKHVNHHLIVAISPHQAQEQELRQLCPCPRHRTDGLARRSVL